MKGEILYCEHVLAYQIVSSGTVIKYRDGSSPSIPKVRKNALPGQLLASIPPFQVNGINKIRVMCLRCFFSGPWVQSKTEGLPSQRTARKALSEWYKAIEKKESE